MTNIDGRNTTIQDTIFDCIEQANLSGRMASVDEFLRNLEQSNLLAKDQWAVVRREIAAAKNVRVGAPLRPAAGDETVSKCTPAGLAARLVELTILTRWQADMLLAGKKQFFLGKYRLLDLLGTGGMGAVFKARHADMRRTVAIKILTASVMKNQQAVARFKHEIQAAAALDDPHIVAAYDAGSEKGGMTYLVMEYVEGHDLGYLVKHSGPLPIAWACECILQAALGLQHAHEQGMVHRDIKPTNLLVTRDREGRPLTKILDLGLARFVSEMAPVDSAGGPTDEDDGSLTQVGQFLGTPDYIAPEQAHDTRAADIRSDIFSLGCTLFRILTGELPFVGETVLEKLEARENHEAIRIRTLRNDIPVELEGVIVRMLARDPQDRYQTPREVAQALIPFTTKGGQAPRPIPVVPPPPRQPTAHEADAERLEEIFRGLAAETERRPLSAEAIRSRLKELSPRAKLAVGGLAVAGIVGFFVWQRMSVATLVVEWPLDEREGAVLTVGGRTVRLLPQPVFTVRGSAGAWELRLRREGYEAIEESRSLRRGERVEFTPHWRPTPATARREAFAALRHRASTADDDALGDESTALRRDLLAFVRKHPGSEESMAATGLLRGLRWPLDLLDGTTVPTADREQFVRTAGNPAAALVGLFGDSRLKFWNSAIAVAASPDGRLLAGASLDGTVRVFDTAEGRRLFTIDPPFAPVELAFSPVGDLLAIAGKSESVLLWNTASQTQVAVLADTAAPIAFSGDGKLIAGRAARQEIALWDAQTGALRRTMQGHATGDLLGLSFSHNGRMLASYGTDQSVLLWDVASGQERRRFPRSQYPVFSSDDDYLAAGTLTSDLVLWDTRTGETQLTFDEGGYPLAFVAGGHRIVSKRLGRAVLWNLETGEEIRTIIDVPELAAISADGQWLAAGDTAVGELRLWNLTSAAGVRIVNSSGPVAALAVTADSQAVITGSKEGVVQVWSLETGEERVSTPPRWGPADLNSDGRTLAVRAADRIELVDVTAAHPPRKVATGISELDSLVFSPDGRMLAGFGGWGFFRTSLRLWDPHAARELPLGENAGGTVRTMAFSPDSQLLAVAGDSRFVTVWNVARRTIRYDLDDFTERVTAIAFHPDGQRLAAALQDQSVALWDLKAGTGKTFASASAICRELAFSVDGQFLAAPAGERVVVWDASDGTIASELATGAGRPGSIAWHPAGTALAAAGNDGELWLWNQPPARRFREEPDQSIHLGPPQGLIHRAVWSFDGRHLVTINGNGTIYVLRLYADPKRPQSVEKGD